MGQVIYTKYANGRGPAFAVRTSMVQEADGGRAIYKEAEYPSGEGHIRQIAKAAQALEKSWADTKFHINRCSLEGKRIRLEFLKGHTLEEELDMLLENGELAAAEKRILEILEEIRKTARSSFRMTSEFIEVFGRQEIPESEPAVEPADIDMIFPNMFLGQEGNLHVIDYEWTFFFPVPVNFILYRSLHYYLESASKRKKLKESCDFYGKAGITPQQQKTCQQMERQFQDYIQGGYVSVGELYHRMGMDAVPLGELLAERQKRRMQVYLDDGAGFREENSYFIEQGYQEQVAETIGIPAGTRKIRIDPVLCDCILEQTELVWGSGKPVEYGTNGCLVKKNAYLFPHSDPKLQIVRIPAGETELRISYRISILEHATAEMLEKRANIPGRIKRKIRSFIKR